MLLFILGYRGPRSKEKHVLRDRSIPKNIHPINYPPRDLTEQIDKLYYSDMWYNPFKMIKRLYSQLHIPEVVKTPEAKEFLKALFPFLSSNTSQMYQIKSELSTLELVIEFYGLDSPELMREQCNILISKIATNIDIPKDVAIRFTKNLETMIRSTNFEVVLEIINEITGDLTKMINFNTITWLNRTGYNPLPHFVLPKKSPYNRNIVRTPTSHPKNLYKMLEGNTIALQQDEHNEGAGCLKCHY